METIGDATTVDIGMIVQRIQRMYKSKEETRDFTQYTIADYDNHQSLAMQVSEGCTFNVESFDKMVSELKKFILGNILS